MTLRVAGVVAIALLLSGCSDADWDHLLSFGSSNNSEASADQADAGTPADAPAPVSEPAAPPPDVAAVATQPSYSVTQTTTTVTTVARDPTNGYCRKMAQSSGAVATRDGLDDAAQQQAADATYKECENFYGESGR